MSFGCCPSLRLTGLLRNLRALRISPGWGVLGVLAFVLWLGSPPDVWSQSIVATIPAGLPDSLQDNNLAVNTLTNKIYVDYVYRPNMGIVTVIDGATDASTDVATGCIGIGSMAVNEVTNKIYVVCDNGVLVIDGVTQSQTTVSDPNASSPGALAVNTSTNKIYVANSGSNNVTVIDGATNSTATVTDPNASIPLAVAVNSITNRIYVLNHGTVTVIDGITNSTTTVPLVTSAVVGQPGFSIAVNTATNKIYAATVDNMSVIAGATNAVTTLGVPAVDVAVNATTNKIYAPTGGDVIVIDGATNSTTTVIEPLGSKRVAVNEATNTIYVANGGTDGFSGGTVTVVNGSTNSTTNVIDPISLQTPWQGMAVVAVDTVTDRIYAAINFSVTVIDGAGTQMMHALAVEPAANGGTVTSNPAGINCGQQSCPASVARFPTGTIVHLSVTPVARGWAVSWSGGACSGTGPCEVPMNSDAVAIEGLVNNVTAPDLAGLSEGSARVALTNAALVLGTVTQTSSATVASGNVISQSPAAGADVTPGSGVNVVLSTGPVSGGGGNGGGGGGGGAIDWLTIGALLTAWVALQRTAARVQPARIPVSN